MKKEVDELKKEMAEVRKVVKATRVYYQRPAHYRATGLLTIQKNSEKIYCFNNFLYSGK